MFFDTKGLPSADEIWEWHEKLARLGPRFTGNQAHRSFTDWLQEQFAKVPGFVLQTERIVFQRWEPEPNGWSLSIQQDPAVGPSKMVPVSYFYPYSGTTGSGSITAKLIDLGDYTPGRSRFWEPAQGQIALVRVPPSVFSLDMGRLPTDGFEPGRPSLETVVEYELYASLLTNPIFQGMLAPVPLLDARRA